MVDPTEVTETVGPGGPGDATHPPPWLAPLIRRGIWWFVGSVVVTVVAVRFVMQARSPVQYLVISLFLALALDPAVTWFHDKRGWRRGSATGLLLGTLLLLIVGLGALLVPVISQQIGQVSNEIPMWIDRLNAYTQEQFGLKVVSDSDAKSSEQSTKQALDFLKQHSGDIVGAFSGLVSIVFALFTVGLFTFYMAANGPKIRRTLFSRAPPDRQERLNWATQTAIEKMGGYLYSRALLAAINGGLFFLTLKLVGAPFALPLALFEGIVAEFIPIVGTYIAAAIPLVVVFASNGPTAALIVLAEVLIYQQIENYFLSPHISQKTIELNPGVAFGAAMAGGAVGGFLGAFFALPIAAVIQAFLAQYSKQYELIDSDLIHGDEQPPPKQRKHSLRGRSRGSDEGEPGTEATPPSASDASSDPGGADAREPGE